MSLFRWIKTMFLRCYANEVLRYIFFGGLTTLVNLVVFALLHGPLSVPREPANVVSVVVAILFAYVVNARFVFESKAETLTQRAAEFGKFISARLVTMVIEVGGVWLLAGVIHLNDYVSKVIIQVIIIALNYVFSKLIVFRK